MKYLTHFYFFIVFLFSQQLYAHSNHGSISADAAIEIGASLVHEFVDYDYNLGIGKLPASWKSVTRKDIKLNKQGAGYYIVSTFNAAEKENQTLYMLISDSGSIAQANFTDEFEGIE